MIDPITQLILEKENISEGILPEITAHMIGGRLVISLGKTGQAAAGLAGAAAAGIALLGALVIANAIIKGSYRFYKDVFSRYEKQCSGYKHGHLLRKECVLKAKIKGYQERARILNKSKGECKKSKNPRKCILTIDVKGKKLLRDVEAFKHRLKEMQNK